MKARRLVGPVGGWLICLSLGFYVSAAAQPADLAAIPQPRVEGLEGIVAAQLEEAHRLTLEQSTDESVSLQERGRGFGELGILYQAYEFNEAASACHRNAEKLDPEDSRWPYYLGHLHRGAGRFKASEAAFRRSLSRGGDELATIFYLGDVMLALDRPAEALAVLQVGLRTSPSSAPLLALLGESQLALNDYDAAIGSLEAALALVPGATRLNHPLAMAYRDRGDLERAREVLARRGEVGLRPPDPRLAALEGVQIGERVHLLRGRAAYGVGRYAEAAEAFRRAVEAQPESARAQVNLGAALAGTGDTAGAIGVLRGAMELDPESRTARFNLAMLLASSDQHDGGQNEAVELLRTVVVADADDLQAQIELAVLLRRRGELTAAASHYERALATHPLDSRARLGYAASLVDLGRLPQALEVLEQGFDLDSMDGLIAHALAKMLAASPLTEQRDGYRALDLASRVFEAQPTSLHAETMALALAELGRCADAIKWQQRGIDLLGADELDRRPTLEAGLARYKDGGSCPGKP